jgi:hypothetical protein
VPQPVAEIALYDVDISLCSQSVFFIRPLPENILSNFGSGTDITWRAELWDLGKFLSKRSA